MSNQLLVERNALRARVAQLESMLAEIEAQEPVAVKGNRTTCRAESPEDADILWRAIVAPGTELYTRPAVPQPVKEDK